MNNLLFLPFIAVFLLSNPLVYASAKQSQASVSITARVGSNIFLPALNNVHFTSSDMKSAQTQAISKTQSNYSIYDDSNTENLCLKATSENNFELKKSGTNSDIPYEVKYNPCYHSQDPNPKAGTFSEIKAGQILYASENQPAHGHAFDQLACKDNTAFSMPGSIIFTIPKLSANANLVDGTYSDILTLTVTEIGTTTSCG